MSGSPSRLSPGQNQDNERRNSLNIYCRLKPMVGSAPCFLLQGSTKVCSKPPPSSNNKPMEFTFKHVFSETSNQKEVFDKVALPLVEQVLQGQNGLLFSYGNTSSGKTYTMKGTLKCAGIIPRCLDVIFNSISQKLAKKNVFKSNNYNGYELQSEMDASFECRKALMRQIRSAKSNKAKLGKKQNSDPDLAERRIDPTQINMINDKISYSVFVSFIEIYNNSAYDLLDDFVEDIHKPPTAKQIREDSKKNMFVHGVKEIEVSSMEEAYEIFSKGLKKRHVAETILNSKSSRSHSVFTIKVVQADLSGLPREFADKNGANIPITVGQLSLVDLAGSERSNRTQNTGKKLVEAGNINNSLMTLRQCFDAIKENQKGGSKIVPYRDSKLTMLFKNFFEGDGRMSMIICINPHTDDFDESLHVLKFAESVHNFTFIKRQELFEERTEALRARHIADINEFFSSAMIQFKDDIKQAEEEAYQKLNSFIELDDNANTFQPSKLSAAIGYINHEMTTSAINPENCLALVQDLSDILKTGTIAKYERDALKSSNMIKNEEIISLEKEINLLKRKSEATNNVVKQLKKEMFEERKANLKAKEEKDLAKEKMQMRKNMYREKQNSEIEKLKRQRTELEMEMLNKAEKLAQVKRVLSDDIISTSSTPSVASCRAKFEQFLKPSSAVSTPRITHSGVRPTARRLNVAVSNRRHRRSRSEGEVWVEHKPAMPVPLNTVLQPSLPKRRSITKLTDAKQVTQGASKYCLMTQTQDSDGDLETRLYKGDVIPTSGGGAQVLFNDVEVLKQVSPDASPKRARDELTDPQPSYSYKRYPTRHKVSPDASPKRARN